LIEKDDHLLTVIRYVERNPLRAKLVKSIENWKFSSYYNRQKKLTKFCLSTWPVTEPVDYKSFIQTPLTASELESARYSANKGKPSGKTVWSDKMIDRYKLEGSIRRRGRPKKGT
jgi:putative transposase